jgi:hypothetical protein
MARLTGAREACLTTVAEGNVFRVSFPIRGKAHYTVEPYGQRPANNAAYEWLRANGYITHGAPSLRPSPVRLTKKGNDYDGTNA